MLVENWVNKDYPCINSTDDVKTVLNEMRKHRSNYALVKDNSGKFAGFVYKGTIANLRLDEGISEFVVFPDFYVHLNSHVEEAALTFLETHEPCLAVVTENLDIVGIITLQEILEAFIELTAMDEAGTRIFLKLPDIPGQLKGLIDILAASKMNILSITTLKEDGYRKISVKVDVTDTEEIAKILRANEITYDHIAREEGF